jgi:hypothetical protein
MNPHRGLTRRMQYKGGKFPGGRKSTGLTGRNYSIPTEYIKLFKQMNKFIVDNKLLRNEFISSVGIKCDSLLIDLEFKGKRIFYKKGATSTFMYCVLEPLIVKIRILQTDSEKMQLLITYLEEHFEIINTRPKVFIRLDRSKKKERTDDACGNS